MSEEDNQVRQRKSNNKPSSMVPKVSNNEDIALRNMNIKDYLDTNDNKGSYIKINSTNIDDDDDDDCVNTKMSNNNVLITNTDDISNNNNNLSDDLIEPLIISTNTGRV